MLAIRMQRTGRKGHAMFRMVVQDTRQTPTSGKVVAQLGHYDPHAKSAKIDIEKASYYLTNGAQPSDRVARLLKKEGVKLPEWVVLTDESRTRTTRNAEKLRKNQAAEEKPAEQASEKEVVEVTEEVAANAPATEPATEPNSAPAEKPAE